MSERELRDRVEALYDELKNRRAELERPESEALARERTVLTEALHALYDREVELMARIPQLEKQLAQVKENIERLGDRLNTARSFVSQMEDLGNPLEESRSNWEDPNQPPGCALGLLVFASFGALALTAGWWS